MDPVMKTILQSIPTDVLNSYLQRKHYDSESIIEFYINEEGSIHDDDDFDVREEDANTEKEITLSHKEASDHFDVLERKSLLQRMKEIEKRPFTVHSKPHKKIIPQPPNLSESKESISKRKMIDYLNALKEKEEWECAQQFRANPIPMSSIAPKFNLMMQNRKEQSLQAREERRKQLLAEGKPFTFRPLKISASAYHQHEDYNMMPFKANPVPKHVLKEKAETLAEQESRKQRIMERALRLLQTSSLPRRLSMDPKATKRYQKSQDSELSSMDEQSKFVPNINRKIPDFKRLHEELEEQLRTRRYSMPSGKAKPFSFSDKPPRRPKEKVIQDIEEDEKKLKETRWPFCLPRKPIPRKEPPAPKETKPYPITHSYGLRVITRIRRQTEEEERKKKEEEERMERKHKYQMLKMKLQMALQPRDETEKKEKKKQRKSTGPKAEEMYLKALERPLLMEK